MVVWGLNLDSHGPHKPGIRVPYIAETPRLSTHHQGTFVRFTCIALQIMLLFPRKKIDTDRSDCGFLSSVDLHDEDRDCWSLVMDGRA